MNVPYWRIVERADGYVVWKSRDGAYQVTKGHQPPDTTAGYHSLELLKKLKGTK